MTELGPRFRVLQTLDHEEPPAALFLARVLDGRLTEIRSEHWATSERSLGQLATPLLRSSGDNGESMVIELGAALVHVALRGGFVVAQAAATSEDAARDALLTLRERLPTPEPVARHDVPVAFWTYTPNGPMPSLRPIAVPEWDEIGENYAAATRGALEPIMRDFKPAHGGQLILWHGEAGTGKTFALRALAWEWRDWCQLHYIVDPDTFFGERADYLMGVLMQPQGMSMGIHVMGGPHGWAMSRAIFHDEEIELVEDGDDEDGEERAAKHWRLLVLEDTGELLTPDAKAIIGQGLSRFLNVVDGLIGQGLRVLVLVTTNEEIRGLHPAVARPGRAAANVEFVRLPGDEARAWLERRGVEDTRAGPRTVAQLYATLEGFGPPEGLPSIGFGDR
ncbi:MAG TPA: DUF5925 domain-containing protein [Gaiellaceae bacterium]